MESDSKDSTVRRSGDELVIDVEMDRKAVPPVEADGGGNLKCGGVIDEMDMEVKECRICHLSSEWNFKDGSDLILLGCSCKNELGTAHRRCAEAWFKLRGGRNCEICGACARNITGREESTFMDSWSDIRIELTMEEDNSSTERHRCWSSTPFCNFLMACLVVTFILPWFFRVNMF